MIPTLFENEANFESYFRDELKQSRYLLVFPKLETNELCMPDLVCFHTKLREMYFVEFKMNPIKKDKRFYKQLIILYEYALKLNCFSALCTPKNHELILKVLLNPNNKLHDTFSHLFYKEHKNAYGLPY